MAQRSTFSGSWVCVSCIFVSAWAVQIWDWSRQISCVSCTFALPFRPFEREFLLRHWTDARKLGQFFQNFDTFSNLLFLPVNQAAVIVVFVLQFHHWTVDCFKIRNSLNIDNWWFWLAQFHDFFVALKWLKWKVFVEWTRIKAYWGEKKTSLTMSVRVTFLFVGRNWLKFTRESRGSDRPLRDILNCLGSSPSLRNRSGRIRLRALMNQLQICKFVRPVSRDMINFSSSVG